MCFPFVKSGFHFIKVHCTDGEIPVLAKSSTSSSDEGGRRHSTVREIDYRQQERSPVAGDDPGIGRPLGPSEPVRTRREPAPMSTQIDVLETDVFGTIPAALIVLMTILAMLGIIANVAMA